MCIKCASPGSGISVTMDQVVHMIKVNVSLNYRLEGCDAEGRPVFVEVVSASICPRSNDEGVCAFLSSVEVLDAIGNGGFRRVLQGLPGFTIVHEFDNGFKYRSIHK